MAWPTTEQLDDLVARFRNRTLPKARWNHTAHLAVGLWHVRRHGPERALGRLRRGITRLNEAHGTPNSDDSGYHETITRAYVALLATYVATAPEGRSTAECVRGLLATPLASKDALFTCYSRERLLSVAARRAWVEPDLHALSDLWPRS
jgi:hypothetical protein